MNCLQFSSEEQRFASECVHQRKGLKALKHNGREDKEGSRDEHPAVLWRSPGTLLSGFLHFSIDGMSGNSNLDVGNTSYEGTSTFMKRKSQISIYMNAILQGLIEVWSATLTMVIWTWGKKGWNSNL